jgi:hypothetical protein
MAEGVFAEIGRCKGCNEPGRLDDGVCQACLTAPNRGRRWAELAARCRREPAVARAMYHHISDKRTRRVFVAMFGFPGAEVPRPPARD